MGAEDDRAVKRELAWLLAMRAVAVVGVFSVLMIVGLTMAEANMRFSGMLAGPVAYFVIGFFIWWRAPKHPVARQMLAATTTLAVLVMIDMVLYFWMGQIDDHTPVEEIPAPPGWWPFYNITKGVAYCFLIVLAIRLVALLPDGCYRFAYERIILRALWLFPLYPPLTQVFLLINNNYLASPAWKLLLFGPLLLGPLLLIIRYIRLPAAQRRTLRWLLLTAVLIIGAITAPLALDALLVSGYILANSLLLAVTAGAAVLVVVAIRHRLLRVDLGIRWTTRYGLLWLIFGLWILTTAVSISRTTKSALPIALAVATLVIVYTVRLSAELAAGVTQVQQQAHELAASRTRIVQAQDSERRRIERDLHDGIQQELIVLVAKLRLVRNKLSLGAAQADAVLTEAQDDTYRVINQLRELSHGIHPAELSDQGFVAAVRSLARRAPIAVTVIAEEPVDTTRYATDIEESVYFLVSEALTNVLKHARASQVSIQFSQAIGSLVVEIVDDGIGIPPDGFLRGSGLTGLRDRVGASDGELEITRNPDRGTTVRARLPTREATDA